MKTLHFLYIPLLISISNIHSTAQSILFPKEVTYISDCGVFPQELPIIEDSIAQYYSIDIDTIHLTNTSGTCNGYLSTISYVDWRIGEISKENFVFKVKDYLVDYSNSNHFYNFNPSKLEIDIHIKDLIKPDGQHHEYSFSTIITDTIRTLPMGESIDLYVYNKSLNLWNKSTKISPLLCQDYNLSVHDTLNYILAELEDGYIYPSLFDNGSYYNCNDSLYTLNFISSDNATVDHHFVSLKTPDQFLKLEIQMNDGQYGVERRDVILALKNQSPILNKFIEEKSFTSGDTIKLRLWSEEINHLLAFQYSLKLNKAKVIGVENIHPLLQSTYSWSMLDQKQEFRSIYDSPTAISHKINEDEDWYTLAIVTDISGTTSDIISLDVSNFNEFLIEKNNIISEIRFNQEFQYQQRLPSSIYSTQEVPVQIYPNPADEVITLDIGDYELNNLHVLNMLGQPVHNWSKKDRSNIIDVSNLSTGYYILQLTFDDNTYMSTKVFIK